jgi:hypothetical protein
MQDNPHDLVIDITPAEPAAKELAPLSVDAIAAYPNMPGFDVDEQTGEFVIAGRNPDGSDDVRLLDEFGRVVVRGPCHRNRTVNLVLFRLLEMKGWERIAIEGDDAFARELAWTALEWDVEPVEPALKDYVAERRKRERLRTWLTVIPVYLLFASLALAVPALVLFTAFGNLGSAIVSNIGYALSALVAIVFLSRMMSKWITGGT